MVAGTDCEAVVQVIDVVRALECTIPEVGVSCVQNFFGSVAEFLRYFAFSLCQVLSHVNAQ